MPCLPDAKWTQIKSKYDYLSCAMTETLVGSDSLTTDEKIKLLTLDCEMVHLYSKTKKIQGCRWHVGYN